MKKYKYLTEIQTVDKVFVLLIMIGAALLYGYKFDMSLTLMHAEDLISAIHHGNFFSFYDIVLEKALAGDYSLNEYASVLDAANYNIFLYILLSITIFPWVFVKKILQINYDYNILLLYFQIVLVIVDVFAAHLMAQVVESFGFLKSQAKLVGLLFLTSILVVFPTVGFDQLDIFYIIFLLLALKEYGKENYILFALWMSVSIMLKNFPIFIFFPLVLLKKKNVLSIFGLTVLAMSSSGIFYLMFGKNAGYLATKEAMDAKYDFVGRIFSVSIEGGIYVESVFLIVFILTCVFAYITHVNHRKKTYFYMAFLGLLIYGTFFILIVWHPQWLVILGVFAVFAIPIVNETRAYIYLETALSLGYLMVVYSHYFPLPGEASMMNNGILPMIFGKTYIGPAVYNYLVKLNHPGEYGATIMAGALIAMIALVYKTLKTDKAEITNYYERVDVYIRILPLALLQLLMIVFYAMFFNLG